MGEFLTPEEFEAWEPWPAAFKRLGRAIGFDEARAEICRRLVLGSLRTCARESFWELQSGPGTERREREILFWKLWETAGTPSEYSNVWQTGSYDFEIKSGYRTLETQCHGIRLEPSGVQQILVDAGHALTLPLKQEYPGGETWVDREYPSSVLPETSRPTIPTGDAARPKGGAPRKGWWDDLWIEVIRRIEIADLNANSAPSGSQLEYVLLDIAKKMGFSPGESTLKPMALKLFKYLKERGGK